MKLAELQKRWLAASGDSQLQTEFATQRIASSNANQRLTIYTELNDQLKQSVMLSLYPVCRRLVGEACFQAILTDWIAVSGPLPSEIMAYGNGFADFIQGCQIVSELGYLSDLVRFEWQWYQAFHAPLLIPINRLDLNHTLQQKGDALVLSLAPCVQLIESAYPLLAIWQMGQPEYQGDFQLPESVEQCNYLLYPSNGQIVVEQLSIEGWQLLNQLKQKITLALACDQYVAALNQILPTSLLVNWCETGIIQLT